MYQKRVCSLFVLTMKPLNALANLLEIWDRQTDRLTDRQTETISYLTLLHACMRSSKSSITTYVHLCVHTYVNLAHCKLFISLYRVVNSILFITSWWCNNIVYVLAAALHCEPRLLKAWTDQDQPHDQGDIMARVGSWLFYTVLCTPQVTVWRDTLNEGLLNSARYNSRYMVDMSHCLSPIHHTFRENRYLLFLTENYAALDILRHYLNDVVASIDPGSDGSSERLLEKMEPFILFGSSFPRDKEFTQVGAWEHLHDALLWRCNGGKSYSSLYGQQSWVLIRVSLSEPHIDEFAVNFLYICCTSCHKSSYFSYHVSWKKKIHKRLADSLSPWWQQWRFHRIIAWLTVTVLSCEQTSSMPTALG